MSPATETTELRGLRLAQGKLTYIGEQTKAIGTVIFRVPVRPVVMDRFVSLHGSRSPYANDELPYTVEFEVSPGEMTRIAALTGTLPGTVGSAGETPVVSYCLVVDSEEVHVGREILVSLAACPSFYSQLVDTLDHDNEAGRRALLGQLGKFVPSHVGGRS